MSTSMVEHAIAHARSGRFVFPIFETTYAGCACGHECSSPGKHPRVDRWREASTRDEATILQWWAQWPNANIGMDCGKSGAVVIDVDVKRGDRGLESLGLLSGTYPDAFAAAERVATPTGGYHFVFVGSSRNSTHTKWPGIDVRGGGGYVLIAPSEVFSQYDELKRPIPGSQRRYLIEQRPPAPVPYPVVETFTLEQAAGSAPGAEFAEEGRDHIPAGEHRVFLLTLAWHLRAVQGLSVEAALPLLRSFAQSQELLEGANPRDPFTDSDLRKMLQGKPAHVAQASAAIVNPLAGIRRARELRPLPYPRQLLVPGLLIRGELHVFYGDDGVGKTSLVAYLLAIVSQQGLDVLVFINEDSPNDFRMKFIASGGDVDRLHFYDEQDAGGQIMLPTNLPEFETILRERKWGAVYFDSVEDLKALDARTNAADEARRLYGPLSKFAQEYGASIICTKHTNKQNVIEGARQIRAKARVVAKIERPAQGLTISDVTSFRLLDPIWSTLLFVEKFSRGKPNTQYAFFFQEVPSYDNEGVAELEIQADGTTAPKMQYVAYEHQKMTCAGTTPEEKTLEEERREKITRALLADPKRTSRSIHDELGGDKNAVFALVREVRESMRRD